MPRINEYHISFHYLHRFDTIKDLISAARMEGERYLEDWEKIGIVQIDQACKKDYLNEERSKHNRLKSGSRLFWPTVVTSLTRMISITRSNIQTNDDLIVAGEFGKITTGNILNGTRMTF